MITDLTQLIQYQVGFYAVQPNVFEVSKPDFLSVYSQESGLPLGEQLYTAKGSQSIGIGTYQSWQFQIDPDSKGSFANKSALLITYDDGMNGTYYRVRPSSIYTSAPMFTFSDRKAQSSSTSTASR